MSKQKATSISLIGAGISTFLLVCTVFLSPAKTVIAKPNAAEPIRQNPVVSKINELIKQGWEDNEVKPSATATENEWLRRVHLDLTGRIPNSKAVVKFLANKKDPQRYSNVVDELIEDPDFVSHMTNVWVNLMVGRGRLQRTDRPALEDFVENSFSENRPWNEIVYDLITAEGHFKENGAVNYLLSQMMARDEAVQATAHTTRLFLGVQVQCTQCHNHPFNKWQQSQFWEFNGFLRQVRRMNYRKMDPDTGRMVDDYSELTNTFRKENVFYERRDGVMQVAFPSYFGDKVDIPEDVNPRQRFGELLREDEGHHLARAMVNRTWSQLFGYGFTRPVDDMGPHNPASHPVLLDHLTEEFVKSNYDIRKLVSWITKSEPYRLSSRMTSANDIDNPSAGEMPLFSHAYVKMMSAEQLYDSLVVASKAGERSNTDTESDNLRRKRAQWMRQFVVAFGTDDNGEATTFNGSIPQALMMMNGPLVQEAISTDDGSYLRYVLTSEDSDADRIRSLYQIALGRNPKRSEKSAVTKILKQGRNAEWVYQDLFWALLNSNEFIFIH